MRRTHTSIHDRHAERRRRRRFGAAPRWWPDSRERVFLVGWRPAPITKDRRDAGQHQERKSALHLSVSVDWPSSARYLSGNAAASPSNGRQRNTATSRGLERRILLRADTTSHASTAWRTRLISAPARLVTATTDRRTATFGPADHYFALADLRSVLASPATSPARKGGPSSATVEIPYRSAPAFDGSDQQPAIDIDRVTDKVVAAIDRRVIAHRERMGRH